MAISFPSFRTIRQFLAPRWLTEGDGELIGYSLDVVKDAFIKRLYLGLLARFPQNDPTGTPAPSDALSAMGHDRRVVRGINESEESYSLRLIKWLDDRKTAGNPFTLLERLAEYTGPGCKFRTVDVRGNWYTRDVDGTRSFKLAQGNWDWDGDPLGASKWSRFWVICYPPATLWKPSSNWGDVAGPSWGDQTNTWGSTATADQVATMRALVADWKLAGSKCVNIVIAFDPASFDPSAALSGSGMPAGLWEHWSRNVGGVQVSTRLATARYWDGA